MYELHVRSYFLVQQTIDEFFWKIEVCAVSTAFKLARAAIILSTFLSKETTNGHESRHKEKTDLIRHLYTN